MNQLERAVLGSRQDAEFDAGLRQLMLTMYNHTASGLAVSGAVAWLTYSSGLLYAMGSLFYVVVTITSIVIYLHISVSTKNQSIICSTCTITKCNIFSIYI